MRMGIDTLRWSARPDDNIVEISTVTIKDAFGDKYEEFRWQQFAVEATS